MAKVIYGKLAARVKKGDDIMVHGKHAYFTQVTGTKTERGPVLSLSYIYPSESLTNVQNWNVYPDTIIPLAHL